MPLNKLAKTVYKRYRRSAERRNFYWELSFEDFLKIARQFCAYCDRPPSMRYNTFVFSGLDRKNPKAGYTLENIAPCCAECNRLKWDTLTPEETRHIAQALKAFRAQNKRE